MPRTPNQPPVNTIGQTPAGFVPPNRDFAQLILPIQVKGGWAQLVVSGPNLGEVIDQLRPIMAERDLAGLVEKGVGLIRK